MVRRLLLPAVVAATVFGVVVAGRAATTTTKLSGVDGPAYTITVKSGGKTVKTLKAGAYTLVVADKSNQHNFHLFGPGVSKSTGVPFTGTKTWKVTLKKGTYTYQCDIHAVDGMKGTLKVT
jgi:plastocyanin